MQLPENIKTRISYNGKLRVAIKRMSQIVRENPSSDYARSVLRALYLKFFLGSWKVQFSTLIEDAWSRFSSGFTTDFFEIGGMKFVNDNAFINEFIDIFLNEDYLKKIVLKDEGYFAAQLLSLLAQEGSYEYEDVKIHKNDIIIDAGANMGLFSIYAYKKEAEKIYAFEPQTQVIEILKKNIDLNNASESIEIVPLGLWDKYDILQLFHSACGHSCSSIVLNRNNNQQKEDIHCVDLDTWVKNNKIPRIDFIKADIEGAERYMLHGAKEILHEFGPRLAICSYHLPDDLKILKKIVKDANPKYRILHNSHKMFAYID